MTNENPESPLKPQVIDLDAEDVIVEEADKPAAPPPPPSAKKSVHPVAWLAIALLGGGVAGGWFYKDVLSSYVPSNELVTAQARIDTLEAQTKTLGEQLVAVSGTSDQLKTEIQSATEKSSAAQNASAALETRMASIEAAAKSVKAELEKLKSAPAAGGTTGTTVDNGALATLAQRLDALEKDVASLKTVSTPGDQTAATATLSQSMSDLKAKIASGASYSVELERISRMVPAAAGLDTLSANANEGLPTAAGLAAELTGLIPLLPKQETELPSSENSYLDSFWDAMKGVITVRRIGETDWPDLAAKCAALAESGDLAQAIERIDKAEGAKPSAFQAGVTAPQNALPLKQLSRKPQLPCCARSPAWVPPHDQAAMALRPPPARRPVLYLAGRSPRHRHHSMDGPRNSDGLRDRRCHRFS